MEIKFQESVLWAVALCVFATSIPISITVYQCVWLITNSPVAPPC